MNAVRIQVSSALLIELFKLDPSIKVSGAWMVNSHAGVISLILEGTDLPFVPEGEIIPEASLLASPDFDRTKIELFNKPPSVFLDENKLPELIQKGNIGGSHNAL